MIIICPKCKKGTAQRDMYTGECVCYNAHCEYKGPSVIPKSPHPLIRDIVEYVSKRPVIVKPLVDYDVD